MGAPQPPGPPDPSPSGREQLVREANTDLELRFPGARRTARLAWRALTLHCPHCGKGPVLVYWWRMRDRCGHCGLLLQRGESDYFIGSMMFNVLLSEALFAAIFVAFLLVRWPEVPWDAIQVIAPAGMVLAPLVLYPFSKLAWLAFDLAFRPSRRDP